MRKLKDAHVPAILIQGDQDTVVPPEYARQWADSMKETGMTYKYVEMPEGDHCTVISGGMPDLLCCPFQARMIGYVKISKLRVSTTRIMRRIFI
jgi:hypothetical protein